MYKRIFIVFFLTAFISVTAMGKSTKSNDEFIFQDNVDYTNTVKIQSVALLPFKHEVGKQSNEEVGELLASLKTLFEAKGIKVIDATNEMENQKIEIQVDELTTERLTAIGKALGADIVLSGSIVLFQTSSKKAIASVGITGNILLTSSGSFVYKGKLSRDKKSSTGKRVLCALLWSNEKLSGAESKKLRMEALSNCAFGLLEPFFKKIGLDQTSNKE